MKEDIHETQSLFFDILLWNDFNHFRAFYLLSSMFVCFSSNALNVKFKAFFIGRRNS